MVAEKVKKGCGWSLAVCGIIWLFLAVLMGIDDDPEHGNAVYGGLFMAVFFLVPAAVLLGQHYTKRRRLELDAQLTGYFRSHDKFTVEEMALKIGRTQMETEGLISELIAREGLQLVFHRPTRSYYHRDRIKSAHRYVRQCAGCGAALTEELLFADDHVGCTYCGADLATA